eukprot:scaffold424761_cov29-Prasinocladus_malaysianus.AAC.1
MVEPAILSEVNCVSVLCLIGPMLAREPSANITNSCIFVLLNNLACIPFRRCSVSSYMAVPYDWS